MGKVRDSTSKYQKVFSLFEVKAFGGRIIWRLVSLFLAEVDVDGAAGEVELLSQSVFQETSVWLLDVLREVAEEGK